jgi:hypothetical protein
VGFSSDFCGSFLCDQERKAESGLDSTKMHVIRYLLIQLLLQLLLHPEEYWEAAIDVIICCKKTFPSIAQCDSSSLPKPLEDSVEDSDEDGSEEPNEDASLEFMDVLVQTFLSLLPHVSGPVCFTIEQASIHAPSICKFCNFEKSETTILRNKQNTVMLIVQALLSSWFP